MDTAESVGYLTFDNANTYTIGTAGSSNLTLDNGTSNAVVIVKSGSHIIAENVLLNSNLTVAPSTGTTLTVSGNISGSKSLQLTDAGTLVLAGANSYTGTTTVNAGTLSLTGSINGSNITVNNSAVFSQLTSGSIAGSGATFTHNSTGTSTLAGPNTFTGATTVNAGTLSLTGTINGSSITINNGAAFSESSTGVITGGGTFTHSSTGTSTLAGPNTYTGATTVNAGTLNLTGSLSGTSITVNFNSAFNESASGVIAGGGSFNQNSTGTSTLAGADSYTGGINIAGGTLNLTGNRTANPGTITIATIDGNTGTLGVSNGTFTTGTILVGNTLGAIGILNQTGGTMTTSGNELLVGQGGIGTYNLSGGQLNTPNSALGVVLGVNTITTGIFNLSGTGILNMTSGSTLQITRSDSATANTSATFNQTGGTATVGILTVGGNAGGTNANATMNLSGGSFTATSFSLLSAGTASISNINISGSAVVTLPAFPTARGTGATATLTFNGGTLKPAAASTTYLGGLTNAFIRAGGATIDTTNGSVTITQNLLTDAVSTGGGLTKSGINALTLTGANTYTGPTVISGGTLQLNGSSAGTLTTSGVTVGNTGTLGFTAGAASTLNLGAGSLSLGGGTIAFDIGAAGVNDALTVGSVALSANSSFTFNTIGAITSGATYTLLTATSPIVANGFSIAGQVVGQLTLTPTISGNTITLTPVLAEGTWNQPGGGNWSTTSNWTNYKPTNAGDAALFGSSITAPSTINVDTPQTVGYMRFNNVNAYTIGNAGSSNLTLNNGTATAVITVTLGSHIIAENVTLASTVSVAPATGQQLTINGNLSGTGGVQVNDAGTLVLAGANTYTGATAVNAGTLSLTGSIGASSVTVNNGGVFNQSSTGTMTGTAATFTHNSTGTSTLAGMNSYTGATTITAGTVNLTGTLSGGGPIAVSGSGVLTESSTGVISGGASITYTSTGTSTLVGADTYTGATTVNSGTLILDGNRTGTSTFTVQSGGVLGINNGTFTMATMTLGAISGSSTFNQTGGSITFTTGGVQLIVGNGSGDGVYNLSGGTLTTAGVGSRGLLIGTNNGRTGTFTVSGTGTLIMDPASTLEIGRSENTPATNTTGIFNQTGGTATVGELRMGGVAGNTSTTSSLNLTGGVFTAASFTFLSAGDTSTSTINIGGTADVTLPAFPTARGANSIATVNFNGGILRPMTATTTFMGGLTNAFIKAGGATIDTTNGSITIAQPLLTDAVSTGGGLTKNGTNTLTLTGANTYTGATTVNAGTLQLEGSAAGTFTGGITVNAGGSFGFTAGTASTLNLGSKTLTLGGGTIGFDLGTSGTNDALTVGNVTLTANTSFTFNPIGLVSNGSTYTLVTSTNPIVTNGNSIAGQSFGVLTLNPTINANTITLTATLSQGIWNQPGGGNWSTVSNWTNYQPTNAGDAALFGSAITGPATINVDTPQSVGYITFANVNTYTIGNAGSSNLTLDNGASAAVIVVNSGSHIIAENVNLNSNLIVVPASGTTLTVSGSLNGAANVQLNGIGTLVLSGANSYSGTTTISAGTLMIGGAGQLGNGFYAANIINNASFVFASSASQILAGVISGTGSLTHSGTGVLTLTGANTFTGAIAVNAGATLEFSPANTAVENVVPNAITGPGTINVTPPSAQNVRLTGNVSGFAGTININPSASTGKLENDSTSTSYGAGTIINVANGATWYTLVSNTSGVTVNLNGSGNGESLGALRLGGILDSTCSVVLQSFSSIGSQLSTEGSGTINGVISESGGSFGINKVATGTITLGGVNTYSGDTYITGGTLTIAGAGQLGAGNYSGNITNNGAFIYASSATQTVNGAVSGSGSLTQSAGSLTLTGTISYTGSTTVTGGALTFSGGSTGTLGGITVAGPGATLNIQAGGYAVGGGGIFVGGALGSGTVNQTGGSLTWNSNSLQLLLGNNNNTTAATTATYNLSGGSLTTVDGNTVRGVILGVNNDTISIFNLSGTGALNVNGSSGLFIGRAETGTSGSINTINTFNQTGGTATISNLSMGGAAGSSAFETSTLNVSAGVFIAAAFPRMAASDGDISTINISGTGDVTLPAFPTARGASATATITFNGGILRPAAASTTFMGGLTNAFIKAGGAAIDTTNGSITIAQALLTDAVSTGGGLTVTGPNTLTLTGANTYTGTTTITGGVLAIGAGGTSGTLGSGPVSDNAVLAFNRSNALTVASSISGSGTLQQNGSGQLILTGVNNYTGATTVNSGILTIQNSLADSGGITVNGGTLGGTGTIGGAVTVNSSGQIRGDAGTGTGTLTVGNTSVLSGGALFADLGASGTSSQLALGANTLSLSTGSILRLSAVAGFTHASATYTLASLTSGNNLQLDGSGVANGYTYGSYVQGTGGSGPVVFDMSAFSPTLTTGDQFMLERSGNNLVLVFTIAVPEPAMLLVLAFGILLCQFWYARRGMA